MNYNILYTRFCARKTILGARPLHVQNQACKRADMHVTNVHVTDVDATGGRTCVLN